MQLVHGAADAFNAMLYGAPNPQTKAFLAQQIDAARSLFVGAGQQFIQRAQQAFNHYNDSAAIRFAREVMSKVQGKFDVPMIQEYGVLEQMQNASVLMQRWIMANPVARALYHAQRCDGYSDTYIDVDPGKIGDAHYDYRRAVEGVMLFEDKEDDGWVTKHYSDDLREGDRHLLLSEQTAILRTWDQLEALYALAGDDPTSPTGGKL